MGSSVFWEKTDGASAIFWPAEWVSSGTLTLGYQAAKNAALRIEYRHDQAEREVYFSGDVAVDPVLMTPIADAKAQDTLTVGVTAWF